MIEKHPHSRVEYMIKAKSQFKRRSTANNVEIIIPVPGDVDSQKFKTTIGHCKYAPEQSAIIWTIKSFPGGKEYLMRAHFNLPSVSGLFLHCLGGPENGLFFLQSNQIYIY